MKNFLIISLLFITACNRTPKTVQEQMTAQHTVYYQAIDGKDTAWLTIDTAHRQMIGLLKFSYANQDKYDGEVKGVISGDTLKGHFNFKVNGIDKWYRNPVAFLKRDQKLVMGVGKFTLIWGSAYFDAAVPIDYDKGRFIFEEISGQP